MRFRRIRVGRFGPLEDAEWGGDEPLPSLVAVLGPNEAGKSAFHELLATLLFGFYPASREGNPWSPWSGEDLDVAAAMHLGEGDEVEVHRRLLSSPWAQLRRDGRVEELRNEDLPFVRHVRREVFLQVYALTLQDLAGLEGRGWEAVQDRLVVGMGARDIRSPREVLEAWAREAQGLWRPDRRGSPRHREIRERLRELRNRRRDALDRDRELRKAEERSAALEGERERLRRRRRELDEDLDRVRRLLPLRARLRRIRELEEAVGDPEELRGLPAAPGERLAELDRRLRDDEEAERRLATRIEGTRERAERLTDEDRALFEREGELRDLAHRSHLLQERAARRGEVDEEIRALDRRIREEAPRLFDEPEEPLSARSLDGLDFRLLDRRSAEASEARTRAGQLRASLEEAEGRAPPPDPRAPLLPGALLALAGAAALALAALWDRRPLSLAAAVIGTAALLGAALLLVHWWGERTRDRKARSGRDEELAALRERVREAEEGAEALEDEIRRELAGLPLRAELRERPGPSLVGHLERLRTLLHDREDRSAVRDRLEREDRAVLDRLAALRGDVLPDLPPDPVAALAGLAGRLRELDRRVEEARTAEERLEELETERGFVEDRLESHRKERDALVERLTAAGGRNEDPDAVVEAAEARLRARDALAREREELAREFPDLEELEERLREAEEAEEPWLERGTAVLEEERDSVQDAMDRVGEELEELRERLGELAGGERADVLDGEIELLEEELAGVRRERDRLHVLGRLVARAERRFREEHQPDLLRRAGAHLDRITGGRYPGILLGEGEELSTFFVQAPHLPHPLPAAFPLSTGTREQIYLALRLAIVDHLDEGREPLPLFLDEVLVNWDRDRRGRGLDLLAEMAERRQVFLFTCHPALAGEVEDRGGRILELDAP